MVKCHLQFTDFPTFCQELVRNLHGTTDLSDISLIGDDNKPIRAHKIILSTHSSIIREALSSSAHEKPLLHCRGFNSQDIQFLLEFMYLGETSCEAKHVNLFFKTGKFLQIKQLEDECDDDADNLRRQFSLDVLDQFCEIIASDKEVKDEEVINQTETNQVGDNNADFCEEKNLSQEDEEKEDCDELALENFYVDISEKENETKNTCIKETKHFSKTKRKMITAVKRLYNSAMLSFNEADPTKEWKALDETEIKDLNTNLCKFFECLENSYNFNTLMAYFSALRGYLRETKSVDIKRDERFKSFNEIFCKRLSESKIAGSNRSTAFRENDIRTAFRTGAFGRGNPEALIALIVYNLIMDFGCKGRGEIKEIRNCDLIYGPMNAQAKPAFIKLSDSIMKKRNINYSIGRVDIDPKMPQTCPVENILIYQSKKTPEQLKPDMPFILSPRRTGSNVQFWFQNQQMGIETLRELFRTTLEKAGIDLSGQKITLMSAYKARIRKLTTKSEQ